MVWVDLVIAGKLALLWGKPCIQDQKKMTGTCELVKCHDAN